MVQPHGERQTNHTGGGPRGGVTVLKGKRDFFVRGLLVVCMAVAFSYVGSAEAQLSKDDTKCINAMNKDYGKLASSIGKDIAACVKFKGKGKTDKLGPAPSTAKSCVTADVKGKVLKASCKVDSDYGKKCPSDPDQPFWSFALTQEVACKRKQWNGREKRQVADALDLKSHVHQVRLFPVKTEHCTGRDYGKQRRTNDRQQYQDDACQDHVLT